MNNKPRRFAWLLGNNVNELQALSLTKCIIKMGANPVKFTDKLNNEAHPYSGVLSIISN